MLGFVAFAPGIAGVLGVHRLAEGGIHREQRRGPVQAGEGLIVGDALGEGGLFVEGGHLFALEGHVVGQVDAGADGLHLHRRAGGEVEVAEGLAVVLGDGDQAVRIHVDHGVVKFCFQHPFSGLVDQAGFAIKVNQGIAAVELFRVVEPGLHGEAAQVVDVAPLAVLLHRRQALGEFVDIVKPRADHQAAGFIDEAPFLPDAHGDDPFREDGPGLVVDRGHHLVARRVDEALVAVPLHRKGRLGQVGLYEIVDVIRQQEAGVVGQGELAVLFHAVKALRQGGKGDQCENEQGTEDGFYLEHDITSFC